MNTATHSVEVPFPQAFASPKRSPFPSAPRYGLFLALSDRQSDREVGMRPPKRSYTAYHHYAQKQLATRVLLPTGTIDRGTRKHYLIGEVLRAYQCILAQQGGIGNGMEGTG